MPTVLLFTIKTLRYPTLKRCYHGNQTEIPTFLKVHSNGNFFWQMSDLFQDAFTSRTYLIFSHQLIYFIHTFYLNNTNSKMTQNIRKYLIFHLVTIATVLKSGIKCAKFYYIFWALWMKIVFFKKKEKFPGG